MQFISNLYVFQGHLQLEMNINKKGSPQELLLNEVTNITNAPYMRPSILLFCLRLHVVTTGLFYFFIFLQPKEVAEFTRNGSFQITLLVTVDMKPFTVKKKTM